MADYSIGVDLGGTNLRAAAITSSGEILDKISGATNLDAGRDAVLQDIVDNIVRLRQRHGSSGFAGAGLGVAGFIRIREGIVVGSNNMPALEGVRVRDEIENRLGAKVILENDANAAALGEFICGAGRDVRDMVLLTLGTGIGSGIILDGNILHGAHEIGGELGHMIVDPQGEPCDCGQQGCLEACCSAKYLVRAATRKIRQDGVASSLRAALDDGRRLGAKEIQSAAEAGDELAAELWDRAARFLALGCVNVCRLFDPEQIVFTGGMARAGGALLDPVRAHFSKLHWRLTEPRTEIVLSSLGADAGVIGAAGVAWQAFAST